MIPFENGGVGTGSQEGGGSSSPTRAGAGGIYKYREILACTTNISIHSQMTEILAYIAK